MVKKGKHTAPRSGRSVAHHHHHNARLGFALDWRSVPDAAGVAAVTFWILVALIMVVMAGFVIPQWPSLSLQNSLLDSAAHFELRDELNTGLFGATARLGETHVNDDATFHGIALLGASHLAHNARTVSYASSLEDEDFGYNMRRIYEGVVMLKTLNLLHVDHATDVHRVDGIYNLVMQLHEPYSGFRLHSERAPSVDATYYAFAAIRELDRMDVFRSSDAYKAAILFVTECKEYSGGFNDGVGSAASIDMTFKALHVLLTVDVSVNDLVAHALADVHEFVLSCQHLDGGFLSKMTDLESPDWDTIASNVPLTTDTALALRSLLTLAKRGVIDEPMIGSDVWTAVWKAMAYLQVAMDNEDGVLHAFHGHPDIEALHAVFDLLSEHSLRGISVPRVWTWTAVSVTLVALVQGIFHWYRNQVAHAVRSRDCINFQWLLGALSLATSLFYLAPVLAMLVCVVVAIYMAIVSLRILRGDTAGGSMIFIVCSLVALQAAYVTAFPALPALTVSQLVFTMALPVLVAPLFSFVATRFGNRQSMMHCFASASVSWVVMIAFSMVYAYTQSSWPVLCRVVQVQGVLPVVCVALPVVSLFALYIAYLMGAMLAQRK